MFSIIVLQFLIVLFKFTLTLNLRKQSSKIYDLGKKYLEKSNKTGKNRNILLSAFEYFLTTTTKFLFLSERLGIGLCFHPILRFSNYCLISTLYEKCESVQIQSFFWFVFSRIPTDYGQIRTRDNSIFEHFSCSGADPMSQVVS